MADWTIGVGQRVKRSDVHDEYGGRRQGGIGPSRVTPNVLLFTDPAKGHKHGYFDGWGTDGCYHYAGEGQFGEQRMVQGNLAVLNHQEDGRALRLFRVSTGVAEYMGAFILDDHYPWYLTDAPETDSGRLRSVIMFRLRPLGEALRDGAQLPNTPPRELRVSEVGVEEQQSERMLVSPSREPYTAERREATLVQAYTTHLRLSGHEVVRHCITPPRELKHLYTDIYDKTQGVLIEAKGSVTRESIRMAIGQLFDYRRHLTPKPTLAILLPSRPRADLLDLCTELEINVIWADGESFEALADE